MVKMYGALAAEPPMKTHILPPLAILLFLVGLSTGARARSQDSRDDWKAVNIHNDLLRSLPHSLRSAPITEEERRQIYSQVDKGLRQEGLLGDGVPGQARSMVLAAQIGTVQLADDVRNQFLVKAPREICGNGGCPFWLFIPLRGQLQVALSGGAGALLMRKSMSHGFHDLVTVWHRGGGEAGYEVFRWNGRRYESSDCYITRDQQSGSPEISDCK